MHPNFKPLHVGRSVDIRQHSHMLTPVVYKMIPAKDSWHPCFDQVLDANNEFVSGNVKVSLFPSYVGVVYNNLVHVEKWTWRITIWGNDDSYAEKEFDTYQDAKATYDALDSCPFEHTVFGEWGFGVM